VLPGLRERHFGTWEGLTNEEIFTRFPDARSGSWADGETKKEMRERVLGAVRRIAAERPGGHVLVRAECGTGFIRNRAERRPSAQPRAGRV